MSDYISREAAIAYIREQCEEMSKAFEELGGESGIYADAYNDLAEDFNRIHAADVAHVVHCKDCVYSRRRTELEKNVFIETVVMCTNSDMHDDAWPMYETDYCSYGKANEVPNGSDAD